MKKKLLSLTLALALCLGLLPAAFAAEGQPTASTNKNRQDYTTYGSTVKSYLYENQSGGLTRVEYVNNQVVIEDYSSSFQLQASKTISPELPIWGGFFAGEQYNFLFFGQKNTGESKTAEVIRVVKYDKDWNRLGQTSLKGANTTVPFDAGSLRCDEYGGYLYVRTCHEMFKSDDGINHQSNMTLQIKESDMTLADAFYDIWVVDWGYISHSFNQFILVDQDRNLIALDHSDSNSMTMGANYNVQNVNTRGAVLVRYDLAKAGSPSFTNQRVQKWCSFSTVQAFAGTSGNNTTGASLGGLAETSGGYVSAYNYDGTARNGDRNVYLGYTAKNGLKSATVKVSASAGSTTPVLASTGLNGGYVLWNGKSGSTANDTLYYASYSADGKPGQVQTASGSLSDCQPIQYNGKTVWYTTDSSAPTFYTLDASGVTAVPANGSAAQPEQPSKPEQPEKPVQPETPEQPEQPDDSKRGTLRYSEVITPQYDDAGFFSDEGLAPVKKNGKWGYINTAGKLVIPFQYEKAFAFSEGLAVVFTEKCPYSEEDDYYNGSAYAAGIIDEQGHFSPLRDPNGSSDDFYIWDQYERPSDVAYHNGFVLLTAAEGRGDSFLFDKTGKMLSMSGELKYSSGEMNEGLAPAYLNDGWQAVGWVDAKGNTVKAFHDGRDDWDWDKDQSYISHGGNFNQGLAPVWQSTYHPGADDTYQIGFMNRSFQWVIQPQFSEYYYLASSDSHQIFGSTGLAMVAKGDKWGAIDKSGKTVIPFQYEMLQIDGEGLIGFKLNGKWGYLDAKTHQVAIPAQYAGASMFKNGLATVTDGTKAFLIDKKGNPVPGADQLDMSSYFIREDGTLKVYIPDEYILIQRGGKYGYGHIEYFPDLPGTEDMDAWAYETVCNAIREDLIPTELQNLYQNNITRNEFCQLVIHAIEEISRQDIWSLVEERTGKSLSAYQQDGIFLDANNYTAIAANALGIVSGRGDGSFDPYADISRQEAAVLLMNAAKLLGADTSGSGSVTFSDSGAIGAWARNAVSFVCRNKIMNGTGNNAFSPLSTYTREQAFITIYNLYQAVGG